MPNDLAAIHQKLSDALARYEAATYPASPRRLDDIIEAVRERDVARRAVGGAGGDGVNPTVWGPECASTATKQPEHVTSLAGASAAPPAEPAPPTPVCH